MLELIITDRIHSKVASGKSSPRFISMRPLKRREIAIAQRIGLNRYYLPNLNQKESDVFFAEFDHFWDEVIKPFGTKHPFWRNAVSSKMQEWEKSAAYFALILFCLSQKTLKSKQVLIIVCASIEEEDICESWGKKLGWKVIRKPCLSLPTNIRKTFQEIKQAFYFLFYFLACIYYKFLSPKFIPKLKSDDKSILIDSLFYQSSIKDCKYTDPFFGDLHSDLSEKGGRRVINLCNPLEKFKESVKRVGKCNAAKILLPYSIITWYELCLLALKVFLRRIRLPRTDFIGCDFSKLIAWNARRDFFFNLDAEIYYAATKRLCKLESFDRLILLYEGNVFERGCIQAFREYGSAGIVGYSHAVIFPLNLKIRLTDNEKKQRPEPDVILTTGATTKKLMEKIGRQEPYKTLAACSLRMIPLSIDKTRNLRQAHILVALDGVWGSASVLNWLLEQKDVFKGFKVKLRGHPNIPINKLSDQCLYDLPDNFYITNQTLKEDMENSFCVIYRQTSVGLQALMNGVPVIHLNVDAPLDCDPIKDIEVLKWVVHNPEELRFALEEIQSLKEDHINKYINIAKEYTENYFTPPDESNKVKFLLDIDELNRKTNEDTLRS